MNYLERIRKKYQILTSQEKKVADFLVSNGFNAAFLSIKKLAHEIKTSQATVVRFSQAIGYKGFVDLQKELKKLIQKKLSPVEGLEKMILEDSKKNLYWQIFQNDTENLKKTYNVNSSKILRRTVNELASARNIGFFGCRTSYAISYLLYYYLSRIRNNCELLENLAIGRLTNYLLNMGPNDLLVCVSFPRYAQQTIDIMKCAKKRGLKTLIITDKLLSPPAQIADLVLLAERESPTYFNSLTSAVSLVNYLAAEVSLKIRKSLDRFKAFDEMDKELLFKVMM